jgi:hypothetical protein
VLDAVFDFAEHLIAQQRIFAKQMLAATSHPQQSATQVTGATDVSPPAAARAVETDPPKSTTTGTTSAAGTDTASSANQ